jgi:hypothetical protein
MITGTAMDPGVVEKLSDQDKAVLEVTKKLQVFLWRGSDLFEVTTTEPEAPKLKLFPYVSIEEFNNDKISSEAGQAILKQTEEAKIAAVKRAEQALDERIKTREPPSPDKSPDRDASKVSSQMDAKESEIISEALAAIFDSDTSGFLLGSTLLQEVRIAASVPNSTFRVVDAEKKANVFYLHTQHRFPTSNGESIYWEREFICIGLDKATVIISISIPSGADHRSRDGSWVNSWLASLRVPLE